MADTNKANLFQIKGLTILYVVIVVAYTNQMLADIYFAM